VILIDPLIPISSVLNPSALVRFMAPDDASGRGTQHSMMSGIVARGAALMLRRMSELARSARFELVTAAAGACRIHSCVRTLLLPSLK
jgi:hypothetical protein